MITPPDDIDSITEKVIGCAIEVHRELGPGLLESIYRECLLLELTSNRLRVVAERRIRVNYKGAATAGRLELDLLIEAAWLSN